jgi:hypothetical protein
MLLTMLATVRGRRALVKSNSRAVTRNPVR